MFACVPAPGAARPRYRDDGSYRSESTRGALNDGRSTLRLETDGCAEDGHGGAAGDECYAWRERVVASSVCSEDSVGDCEVWCCGCGVYGAVDSVEGACYAVDDDGGCGGGERDSGSIDGDGGTAG